MSVKIFVVTNAVAEPVQVGPTYFATSDAASSINGGDFDDDLRQLFPDGGVELKEIRIVPDKPELIEWSDG
jgi:hypothetical protein